jgi:5-methylcytosine-specific restriction enzyme B
MNDALTVLSTVIAQGQAAPEKKARPLLEALFGGRYHKRFNEGETQIRDALNLDQGKEKGVPFAGLIHPDNPPSGVYGGASLIWFPTQEHGSIITFVVGTGGLSPDEGLLSRPGHRRRIAALRRYLTSEQIPSWTKEDPTALGVEVPRVVRDQFKGFEPVLQRYGTELYAVAKVPTDPAKARPVVQAFFDLYAFERGWTLFKDYENESRNLLDRLRSDLFRRVDEQTVYERLTQRRFVILQGPPGTGKTRMGERVRDQYFAGRGRTVQFHPAVTYEDFLVGLSPDPGADKLHFRVRPGWLLEAARQAKEGPFLLVIDEINRADLGKVLGEAIYLFEPAEVGGSHPRSITLTHPVDGLKEFQLPTNLYVLGTMNTADRSIAHIDLAVRRRFAFMDLPPNREVIAQGGLPLALSVFDRLVDIFAEHAPDEALNLLPGHSYFLAADEAELRQRFRYELLPLLEEYLQEGFVASFAAELQAVRDAIEDVSEHGHWLE